MSGVSTTSSESSWIGSGGIRRVGLLADEQAAAALVMADDRSLVVHVYREAVARDLDSRLARHATTLGQWLAAMRQRTDRS